MHRGCRSGTTVRGESRARSASLVDVTTCSYSQLPCESLEGKEPADTFFAFSGDRPAPFLWQGRGPLASGVVYPDTINDLRVEAGNRGPRLVFRLPSNDVEYVEVYRQCSPLVVEERSLLIARLFQDELVEARQVNQFAFEDGDPAVRAGCRYALKFVDSTGFPSEYSNFVAWTKGSNP